MTPPTFKVTTSDAIDLGSTSEQCFSGIVGILRRLVVCRLQLTCFDHWRLPGSKQTNTLEPMFCSNECFVCSWKAGDWTKCSATCGPDATQTRKLTCFVVDLYGTGRPRQTTTLHSYTLYSLHVPHCTYICGCVRTKSRHKLTKQ